MLIIIFWCFSVINLHGWVRQIVWITAYIGSNFMSNRIIAINHHCFSLSTMASFNCHRCWLLYFHFFNHSSLWMTATTRWDHRFHCKYFSGRSYYRFIDIMITNYIWSTLLIDLTLLFFFFITNYKNRTSIWKVINYHWIKTIK